MNTLDKLQRKGMTDAHKAEYDKTTEALGKMDMIADAFKKAGIPVPEFDRVRKAVRAAHEAIGELFKPTE